MVAIDMEATTVKAHAGIDDLRIYREFSDDPMDKLAEALKDLEARSRQNRHRDWSSYRQRILPRCKRICPACNWIAADAIFNKARQIKTAGELSFIALAE